MLFIAIIYSIRIRWTIRAKILLTFAIINFNFNSAQKSTKSTGEDAVDSQIEIFKRALTYSMILIYNQKGRLSEADLKAKVDEWFKNEE